MQRNDTAAMVKAIPDEMVNTFAIAGTAGEAKARVEELWRHADSLTLTAPIHYLDMGRVAAYQEAIAQTFYAD